MPTDFPTSAQMHTFDHAISMFFTYLPWIALSILLSATVVTILVYAVVFLLRLLGIRRLLRQEYVCLELTPPADSNASPLDNEQLMAVLHGLEVTRPVIDKLLQRDVVFSAELTATREQGIRYVLRVPKQYVQSFQKHLFAHAPAARIREVEDYLPARDVLKHRARLLNFTLSGHFAYPIKRRETVNEPDPYAYLFEALSKLHAQELVSIQLVITPTMVRHAHRLGTKVLHSEAHTNTLSQKSMPAGRMLMHGINESLFTLTDGVSAVAHGPSMHTSRSSQYGEPLQQQAALKLRPARMMSRIEEQLAESVYEKLSEQLFRVSIRAVVVAQDTDRAAVLGNEVRQALTPLHEPRYQSLQMTNTFQRKLYRPYWSYMCKYRLPAVFQRRRCILSASEIAELYHLPGMGTAQRENVMVAASRELPAPVAMRNRDDNKTFDVTVGVNRYHGRETRIGMTARELERHMLVVGATGTGKTTLLKYMMQQDILSGKGVAFIDPHGDAAEEVLAMVPKERQKDVVYINPSDLKNTVGMNLLELPEGLSEDELLIAKDFVTESVVSIFRKIFSDDDSGGHRIEYILRNAIHTAMTVEDATIFTVLKLLRNEEFRMTVTRNLKDEGLRDFWIAEVGKAGSFQWVKMSAGITAKIDRFQRSESVKRMIGQVKSTLDFDEVLNGKILICNLAKGLIGEDTSQLLGISILTKLQLAAYRRIHTAPDQRLPFYLYVDEFQNFATQQFVEMLSEARKYKLHVVMAEQSLSQQREERMVQTILNNAGTITSFRTGSSLDEALLLPRFGPLVREGDINNLPTYTFYIRIQALESFAAMSGETVLIEQKVGANK